MWIGISVVCLGGHLGSVGLAFVVLIAGWVGFTTWLFDVGAFGISLFMWRGADILIDRVVFGGDSGVWTGISSATSGICVIGFVLVALQISSLACRLKLGASLYWIWQQCGGRIHR